MLLLEAGPTFISRNIDNQRSFALISEVKDSKPPRLDKLIPALVLVGAMLIVVAIGPVLFPEQVRDDSNSILPRLIVIQAL